MVTQLSSLSPLNYLSPILGLPNFQRTTSKWIWLLRMLWTAALASMSTIGYISGIYSRMNNKELQKRELVRKILLETFCLGSWLVSISAFAIVFTEARNSIPAILEQLSNIDNRWLQEDRKKSLYERTRKYLYITVFLIFIFNIQYRMYELAFWTEDHNSSNFLTLSTSLTSDFAAVQFITLTFLIKERFGFISEALEEFHARNHQFSYLEEITFSSNTHRGGYIRNFRACYSDLFKMVQITTRIYGLYILSSLFVTTAAFVFSMYYIIRFILVIFHVGGFVLFWMDLSEIFFLWSFHLMKIAVTLYACHQTQAQSKSILLVVHKLLMNPDLRPRDSIELQMFREQLCALEVVFSPYNLLTLDLPLFISVLEASITYLVIILQFQ